MRYRGLILLLLVLAGLVFGVVEASVWLRLMADTDLQHFLFSGSRVQTVVFGGVMALLVIAALYIYAIHNLQETQPHLFVRIAVLSPTMGAAAYALLTVLLRPIAFGTFSSALFLLIGLAIAGGLTAWLFIPPGVTRIRTACKCGLAAFITLILLTASIRLSPPDSFPVLGGSFAFSAITQPTAQRVEPSVEGALFAGAAFAMLTCFLWSWQTRSFSMRTLLIASLSGAVLSSAFCVSHCIQISQIIGSGYAKHAALLTAILNNVIIAFLAGLVLLYARQPRRLLAACMPAAVYTVIGIAYLSQTHAGRDLYLSAAFSHSYRTNVYIHYTGDGGWRRTTDTRSDDIKLLLFDKLINEYPRSMYRPEAMFERAVAAYNSWEFDEAVQTLSRLHRDYPGSRGISRILLYLSLLADGQPEAAAHLAQGGDETFQRWLAGQGARLAALTYTDLGFRARATGLYSNYLDYLHENVEGQWVIAASESVKLAISDLQQSIDNGKPLKAVVKGSIKAPGSVKNIRIALVKPQLDAVSFEDSRQFNGPRTLPIWHGRSAEAASDGSFTIRDVPYGSYEVVVGFDAAFAPEGCVLAPVKSPIVVDSPQINLEPISFVNKIQLISPKDGANLTSVPVLRWEDYPGTASYSVSIITTPSPGFLEDKRNSTYTCWARSEIKNACSPITPDGFDVTQDSEEYKVRHLIPGKTYMWVVYARDSRGRIISSSEHYRLDHEPAFCIKTK